MVSSIALPVAQKCCCVVPLATEPAGKHLCLYVTVLTHITTIFVHELLDVHNLEACLNR